MSIHGGQYGVVPGEPLILKTAKYLIGKPQKSHPENNQISNWDTQKNPV